MKLIKVVVTLALIGVAGYFIINKYVLPTGESWLHGPWWYADSDGNIVSGKDKDGMLFHPNGTVDLIDGASNAYMSCVYTALVDREIRMKCEVRGKTRELIFIVGENDSSLANIDDKDRGAYIRN